MTNEGDRTIQGQAKDGSQVAGVMDEESCCDNKKEGVIRGIYPPYKPVSLGCSVVKNVKDGLKC